MPIPYPEHCASNAMTPMAQQAANAPARTGMCSRGGLPRISEKTSGGSRFFPTRVEKPASLDFLGVDAPLAAPYLPGLATRAAEC